MALTSIRDLSLDRTWEDLTQIRKVENKRNVRLFFLFFSLAFCAVGFTAWLTKSSLKKEILLSYPIEKPRLPLLGIKKKNVSTNFSFCSMIGLQEKSSSLYVDRSFKKFCSKSYQQ